MVSDELMLSNSSHPMNPLSPSSALFSELSFLSSDMLSSAWMPSSPHIPPATDMTESVLVTSRPKSIAPQPSGLELSLPAVLSSYYYYCHPSHPFLPPRPLLQSLLTGKRLSFLDSAIRYAVASLTPRQHVDFVDPDTVVDDIMNLHTQGQYALGDEPYMLQALLLMTIASGTQGHIQQAETLLGKVRELALRLGLNGSEFAVVYGHGNPVLEDCWRRTWWELYIVDTFQSGLHRGKCPLGEVEVDALIPSGSEESNVVRYAVSSFLHLISLPLLGRYISTCVFALPILIRFICQPIAPATSLNQLEDTLHFLQSNVSPYVYRIDAARRKDIRGVKIFLL
jgi:hypothetical protein